LILYVDDCEWAVCFEWSGVITKLIEKDAECPNI
jgi:hypothetical protein